MPKIDVYDINGKKVNNIELNEKVFGIEPNENIVHEVLINYLANQRQGTHDTKTRSEVSGGGRKPWRQKGTGRARQGSTRAPHWPGGGIVFGPHPRSYAKKMNRKERRLALKSALAYKVIESELVIVDDIKLTSNKAKDFKDIMANLKLDKNILIVVKELDENLILASRNFKNVIVLAADEIKLTTGKAKEFKDIMTNLKLDKNVLIVVDKLDENLILASRNFKNVIILEASEINVLDIISADKMVITKDAVKAIEEVLDYE